MKIIDNKHKVTRHDFQIHFDPNDFAQTFDAIEILNKISEQIGYGVIAKINLLYTTKPSLVASKEVLVSIEFLYIDGRHVVEKIGVINSERNFTFYSDSIRISFDKVND